METTARGDVPKTLQTIAYISIPNSDDLEFLLWDLQDAITAYAQLSGTALPHPVDLKANDAGSVADGIVLAIEDVADDKTLTAIEQALEGNPALSNPKQVFPSYFISKLETVGGLTWDGSWKATEAGRQMLALVG